jgi:hypothetical protein
MENVFTTLKKVPLYLADITHSLEDRKKGETKIITLTCETALDAKLASAFDADQVLRRALFRLNNPEPVGYFKSAIFRIPFRRQALEIFTTIDTAAAALLIDQVLVAGVRVRVEKQSQLYTLILRLSFGPASKGELEFCENWRTQTKAVTFTNAEASLDFDTEGDDDEDDEPQERRTPMFDDPRDQPPAAQSAEPADEKEEARQLPKRNADGKPGLKRVH